MQKFLLIAIILSAYLNASNIFYPGLFASVVNVAENDTLNVRARPDYHSKKTGALSPHDLLYVGVDHCKKIGKSTWCKIFHLDQIDNKKSTLDNISGWVNAHFLQFTNKGYVIIDDKSNCNYVLSCNTHRCKVVIDYTIDPKTRNVTSLKTQWIDRKRLKASSHCISFNGTDASGYCKNGTHIKNPLKHKSKKAKHSEEDKVKQRALDILSALQDIGMWNDDTLLKYMHPKKGIIITWNVQFGGKEDLTFTHNDIQNLEKNRSQKIDWGYTYGNGDKIQMSLYDYLLKLTKPFQISKIEKLKTLKGFQCPSKSQCIGYELFWINHNSNTKEHDWQGLVIILEKYQNEWYVVGLLRDRWRAASK